MFHIFWRVRHKTLVSHNTSLLFPLIIFEPDSNQYSYHCMSFKYVSWIRMYISLIAGIQCSWAIYKSTFPTSSYYYNYENDMHFLWTLDSGQTCAWNRRMQDCSHCLQCILFIHMSLLLNLSLMFTLSLSSTSYTHIETSTLSTLSFVSSLNSVFAFCIPRKYSTKCKNF